jgi:hypothetical protein
MSSVDPRKVRRAIVDALPSDTSLHGEVPEQRNVYVPSSHVKALRLECNLVIGARGVGKTFWSAALGAERIRALLGTAIRQYPRISEVRTGFGERPALDAYPDSDVMVDLLKRKFESYHVWRGVVGRWLGDLLSREIPRQSWEVTVDWVRSDPEAFARLLEQANAGFEAKHGNGLIVFDALDRAGSDWHTTDKIVRDLLRVVLSMKRVPRLHAKVFLREDQFEGRGIADFPDASKLLATRVELAWASHDLHGLLWHYLCNAPEANGVLMRNVYERVVGEMPEIRQEVRVLQDEARRDGPTQRRLFVELAGEWMGRDRRRGIPYTWSVGHLADGRGRTSPRSFLAAIRAAAEDTLERYPDHSRPLHYESIKRGVQKASEIRVSELAEDYPWVRKLMEPLRGLTVPCPFEQIESRWKEELAAYPSDTVFKSLSNMRLPPEHYESGWNGVRQDLEGLGIFELMKDGRVNMPDLYRVGFGLGRRGGVKPIVKSENR